MKMMWTENNASRKLKNEQLTLIPSKWTEDSPSHQWDFDSVENSNIFRQLELLTNSIDVLDSKLLDYSTLQLLYPNADQGLLRQFQVELSNGFKGSYYDYLEHECEKISSETSLFESIYNLKLRSAWRLSRILKEKEKFANCVVRSISKFGNIFIDRIYKRIRLILKIALLRRYLINRISEKYKQQKEISPCSIDEDDLVGLCNSSEIEHLINQFINKSSICKRKVLLEIYMH